MIYRKIRKVDEVGSTIETDDGAVYPVTEQDLRKCLEHVFNFVCIDQLGRAGLVDRSDGFGTFHALEKRAPDDPRCSGFAEAHAKLTGHRTGPQNPGPLATNASKLEKVARSAGTPDPDSRDLDPNATAAIVDVHANTDVRRRRNRRMRSVLQKVALAGDYSDETAAAAALRIELRREFSETELKELGLKRFVHPSRAKFSYRPTPRI